MQTLTVTITGIDEGFIDVLKEAIKYTDNLLQVETKDFNDNITIEFNAIRAKKIKIELMQTILSVYAMQNCVGGLKS
jgi:hypothetical protein